MQKTRLFTMISGYSRWTVERATDWERSMPWLVGCNYLPRTAVNQLEMWQRETCDPTTLNRELGWGRLARLQQRAGISP